MAGRILRYRIMSSKMAPGAALEIELATGYFDEQSPPQFVQLAVVPYLIDMTAQATILDTAANSSLTIKQNLLGAISAHLQSAGITNAALV